MLSVKCLVLSCWVAFAHLTFNTSHLTLKKLLVLQFFNLLLQVVEFLVHVRQATEDSL